VSAIVAHKTSDENVALVYQTIEGALITRIHSRLAKEVP